MAQATKLRNAAFSTGNSELVTKLDKEYNTLNNNHNNLTNKYDALVKADCNNGSNRYR